MRTAVLTVSTSVSRRAAEDESGPALAALAEDAGCEVASMEVVPDDFALIEDRLNHYVDDGCDLIFTTGGTGMTPDDITPEATRVLIHREAPGLAEAMRAESARHTPLGILTRGVSGIRGHVVVRPRPVDTGQGLGVDLGEGDHGVPWNNLAGRPTPVVSGIEGDGLAHCREIGSSGEWRVDSVDTDIERRAVG